MSKRLSILAHAILRGARVTTDVVSTLPVDLRGAAFYPHRVEAVAELVEAGLARSWTALHSGELMIEATTAEAAS